MKQPTNEPETNKASKDQKKLKTTKTTKDNDFVMKSGKTMTGSKPDEIQVNPVMEAEKGEHTAVTNLNMRAQPVHSGHAKVIKAVEDEANRIGGSAHIVTSHSEGDEKNPIPVTKKLGYLRKVASKGTHVSATSKAEPSIFHTAVRLNRHAHHLVVVAGSDRAKEYENLLNKYNGKEGPHGRYEFKSIKVKSIGRDPDAEGTEGVSGTKMRQHAKSGNISGFKSGLPPELHGHAEEMMSDINRASKKKFKESVDELFGETFIDTNDTIKVLEAIDTAHREALPRNGDRKKLEYVARKDQDRKKSSVPYRQDAVQKKVLEAKKKPKSGWDRIWDPKTISGRKMIAASDEAQKAAEALRAAAKKNEEVERVDEVSKELIGQVNKKRTLQNIPSKTKKASEVLNRGLIRAAGIKPSMQKEEAVDEERKGLWANIWARRRAGKRMRKPGEKGAPSAEALKSAQESIEIDEAASAGLAAKAKKSGVSLSTLQKVYRRGVAAWNSGHRPGTTPQQWGMARVNSYIAKGKGTYGGADKDLHENYARENKSYHAGLSKSTAAKRVAHWKRMSKYSDRDPRAYEPAPGDATAKTKPSKYTKAYHKKYGD